jgi:non-specific serine/threonine protein kinase
MPAPLTSFPHNLPAPLTSFIGRGREIVELKRLLTTTRLLTLTGAGGCGKTRLALRVAAELGPEFDDGVCLIELAPLTDPDLVPLALGDVLGVREHPGQPLISSLAVELQSRTPLIVLDNCEHLVDACAHLAASLLSLCPSLRILATSREPLRVLGEVVWIVPPLSVPELGLAGDASELMTYEAVRLFLERAAAGAPSFDPTGELLAPVAEICRRLDGIPLAIELAAARVRALPVDQLAQRLASHGPFRLLASGDRTAPPRHQTLEATLGWSYDLLSSSEQSVLQRLSVFAGGCTLEAAEDVCAGGGLSPAEIFDLLARLVEKSLVVAGRLEGSARYRLLETIRLYASRKLEDAGQAAAARSRHLGFFTGWAEAADTRLQADDHPESLALFEIEHDNLRAASSWAETSPEEAERGLRLAVACARFWRLHGHLQEGRARLASAITRNRPSFDPILRARALYWAAELAYRQSDFPFARTSAEAALGIWRQEAPGDLEGIASCLDVLGETATETGDYALAPKLLREALTLFRQVGNDRGIGNMLIQLGWAAMRTGDYRAARDNFEEALPFVGNIRLQALVQSGLGEVAVRLGELDRAAAHLNESLALSRTQGDKWAVATVLGSLGWAAMARRDFPEMRSLLADSLDLRLELNDRGGAAWCLEKLASALCILAEGLPARSRGGALEGAVRVLGAAEALREPIHSVVDPADRPDYDRMVYGLRETLGGGPFAESWIEGRSWSLADAIGRALEDPSPVLAARAEKARLGGLTLREREVAAWIAQGKSNREIAQAMVVGARTVETYVTRILNKLVFQSRVQIATWALERGLQPPRDPSAF